MKGDDDTFVRVDTVLKEIEGISLKKSLYIGNLNLLHRPLRSGKWAVTYEEWPEEVYPPYANGPGYIISIDIAKYIVSQHGNQRLRLFKMEDVSMGMWVEQFNSTMAVQYSHNWKFCQYGCMEGYFTAHYQSPRQMMCLWEKLARGWPHCCNFRRQTPLVLLLTVVPRDFSALCPIFVGMKMEMAGCTGGYGLLCL